MKASPFFCLLLLVLSFNFTATLKAQQLLTPFAGYVEEDGKILSFSLGEVITLSLLGTNGSFTQGFQQPEIFKVSNEFDLEIATGLILDDQFGNGVFFIKGLVDYPNNELFVLNRWGDMVYHARPYQNNWNGYFNGFPLPQATYYYIFYPEAGTRRAVKGNLYLLKN